MDKATSNTDRKRINRYFYKMGKGWYVEAREGLKGPFDTHEEAESFLEELKQKNAWKRE